MRASSIKIMAQSSEQIMGGRVAALVGVVEVGKIKEAPQVEKKYSFLMR